MDAEDLYLQDLFTGKDQFIVPVFQRRYSWKEKHWSQLWEDISSLLDSPLGDDEHFIGAFVSMSQENRPGARPKYLVIDGQQRLITIALILSAIRDTVEDLDTQVLENLPSEQSDSLSNLSDKIQDENLIDPYEDNQEEYRIISRTEDRDALFDVFERRDPDKDTKIAESYHFFSSKLRSMVDERGPYSLHQLRQTIIEQLPLAMITAGEEENPYTIFETLNERGLDLEESDLIRNYVFMQLDLSEQDEFNENHWLPFERQFTEPEDHNTESLTRFYRIFLMRDGEYVKQNAVYDAFKKRVDESPEELIKILTHYSDLYLKIRRPDTVDKKWLNERLSRKEYLDIGTADPLVLNLLDRWQSGTLEKERLQEVFHGLESFAIRRSICDYSTRGYYQIFPSATKSINDDRVVKSVFEYLAGRGWPDDDEFRESFVGFDLYTRESDKCRLIFEILQRDFGHKEPVELDNLQIEHVMPQEIGNGEDGEAWKKMLGENWEEIHKQWKHTPGNLTLTGYNPELSNRKFLYKQELFNESKLDLNDHFVKVDQWTELEIRDRGEALARRVAKLWPVPEVITKEDELSDGPQVTLFDNGVQIAHFDHDSQNQAMIETVEFLFDEAALLDQIDLPYILSTGEGDRAFLSWELSHNDGSEMESSTKLSNGVHLFTDINGNDKQRCLREIARQCGLVCRFNGDWPA